VLHCSSTSWFSPLNAYALNNNIMLAQEGDAATEKLIAFESR